MVLKAEERSRKMRMLMWSESAAMSKSLVILMGGKVFSFLQMFCFAKNLQFGIPCPKDNVPEVL